MGFFMLLWMWQAAKQSAMGQGGMAAKSGGQNLAFCRGARSPRSEKTGGFVPGHVGFLRV
jgi:hypothetical protein